MHIVNPLNGIDLTINEREIIGLFGDSGCGKTTLGKIIAGLEKCSSGKIYFDSKKVSYPFSRQEYKKVQYIYQQPESVFHPRLPLISGLLDVYKFNNIPFNKENLLKELEPFGIYYEHLNRFPYELSGGELQRINLFRALLLKPEFLILDEATSMLDAISQAQMIALLREIHQKSNMTYLFISHYKSLIDAFCDKAYQIKDGIIIDQYTVN